MQTYYSIGKVLAYKLKPSEAVANFTIAENLVTKVFETKTLVKVAQIHNLIKEVYLKDLGSRNKVNLDLALQHAKDAYELYQQIFGSEASNYYIAKSLAALGDIYLEKKELEEAESHYHKA